MRQYKQKYLHFVLHELLYIYRQLSLNNDRRSIMTYDEKLIKILTLRERISAIKTSLEILITEPKLTDDAHELLNICNSLSLRQEELEKELINLVEGLEK